MKNIIVLRTNYILLLFLLTYIVVLKYRLPIHRYHIIKEGEKYWVITYYATYYFTYIYK